MWSRPRRQKEIWELDVEFERNRASVGYGEQCSLARSCVEERGWSCQEDIGVRG